MSPFDAGWQAEAQEVVGRLRRDLIRAGADLGLSKYSCLARDVEHLIRLLEQAQEHCGNMAFEMAKLREENDRMKAVFEAAKQKAQGKALVGYRGDDEVEVPTGTQSLDGEFICKTYPTMLTFFFTDGSALRVEAAYIVDLDLAVLDVKEEPT